MTLTEPSFLIHQATHTFVSEEIYFQAIQMNKSMFIWIGKESGKLGDMSVAVPPFGNQASCSFSRRITMKKKKKN
jgi:hypothetical protein